MTALRPPFASGIYAILDLDRIATHLPEDGDEELQVLLRYTNDAVSAGVVAIQIRAKSVPGHSLWLPTLMRCLRGAMPREVPLILNDHIAALEPITERNGLGVHLGWDDDTPQHGRARLGDAAIIGLSTHDLSQVAAARGSDADYIGFGPINETDSKPNASPITGFAQLAEAVEQSIVPVVAVGGLGLDDLAKVVGTGARCAAVLGAWLGDEGSPNGPNFARMAMQDLVEAWREAKQAR